MHLKRGDKVTNRKFCFSFLSVASMRDIEWFRPPNINDTSTSYGNFRGTYTLKTSFHLLNLGSVEDRQLILDCTDLNPADFLPDQQYSGHESNLKVHKAIQASQSLQAYDGTIISELLLDNILKEDLAGPEEVVLFMSRAQGRLTLSNVSDDSVNGQVHLIPGREG